MNLMLKSLAALTLLSAFSAVDATDQAAAQGNQSTDAAAASVRDVTTGQATSKRQRQKITVKVGKIEDIDGDGVASARALSRSAAASGQASGKRSAAASDAQKSPLYDDLGNKGDKPLYQPGEK